MKPLRPLLSTTVFSTGSESLALLGAVEALRRSEHTVRPWVEDRSLPERYAVLVGPSRVWGGDVAEWLLSRNVALEAAVLLVPPTAPEALAAVAQGVAACVGPSDPPEYLVQTVSSVLAGRHDVVRQREAARLATWGGAVGLSRRQAEVLSLAAHGRTNAEIVLLLAVAERTVRNTLSAAYEVLGVADRSSAVAWAWSSGWLRSRPAVTFVPNERDRYP